MNKYQAHIMAVVQITTEPVESEDPDAALKFLIANVDLDKLLRNVTGTRQIAVCQYTGELQGIVLDQLNEEGNFLKVVVNLDEKDIQDLKEH